TTSMPYEASSVASASTSLPRTMPIALPPDFSARTFAAATPTSVVLGNFPWRYSATTRTLLMTVPSDDLGFVVQDLHQLLHRADLAPGGALGRSLELHDFHARRDVDSEIRHRNLLQLLLARLHDAGEGRVARLVQPEVGGDHGRQRERQGLEAAVDLARDL